MESSFSVALFAVFCMVAVNAFSTAEYKASVDKFTGHFYKAVADTVKEENVVVSGLSADIALAMVGTAARGETAKEISQALFLESVESAEPAIKEFFGEGKAQTQKENNEGLTLKFANKLYVKPSGSGKEDSLSPTYRATIQDVYKGDVERVDFSKSQATADNINAWVEEHTGNRIKNLIDPNALTSFTAAVLINAIYFKGAWANKFDPESTVTEDFTLADDTIVKVEMMKQRVELLYGESVDLDAKIVYLPYKKENVNMVIVLPNKLDGLPIIQSTLQNGVFPHIDKVYPARVSLSLPKFKIETTTDARPIYEQLGAKRVFTTAADLGNMLINEESGLYISKAIQKAFIEVNEEGAEAAVATGAVANTRIAHVPSPDREFNANHPFYFAILSHRNVLFTGHKLK